MYAWSMLYTFIPTFLWFCTFRTVSMSIFGFLYWTRTADRGLVLFVKVFALVISGKLLCRWGWLFRWLQKWKQGEGTVLHTLTVLYTQQENCPLKLVQIHYGYTYTAVMLLAKCQYTRCATNGLWPDEGQDMGLHVVAPGPFQNHGGAGARVCPYQAEEVQGPSQLLQPLWLWQPECKVVCRALIRRQTSSGKPCSQHYLREAILLAHGLNISYYDYSHLFRFGHLNICKGFL